MRNRWRGLLGPAILALPLVLTAATVRADAALVVRGPDDTVLVRVPLADGAFGLRYRNSLYGSLAVERYAIGPDGDIHLVGLAADELAVLEEYYAIDRPARRSAAGSAHAWEAAPAREVRIDALTVAATDLGRRTLLVDGSEPIDLWPLVEDASPSVVLEVTMP